MLTATQAAAHLATLKAVAARTPTSPVRDDDHECEPARVTYSAHSYGVRRATTWCACGSDIDCFLTTHRYGEIA